LESAITLGYLSGIYKIVKNLKREGTEGKDLRLGKNI